MRLFHLNILTDKFLDALIKGEGKKVRSASNRILGGLLCENVHLKANAGLYRVKRA